MKNSFFGAVFGQLAGDKAQTHTEKWGNPKILNPGSFRRKDWTRCAQGADTRGGRADDVIKDL